MTKSQAATHPAPKRCTRTARVVIRATPLEVTEIQQQASVNGWTVSHYLRVALAQISPIKNSINTKDNLRMASSISRVSSGLTYLIRLGERQKLPLAHLRPVIDEVQAVIWELASELRGAKL